MEKSFTVAALAERWDCSDTLVYNLIGRGELRAHKLGAKLYRVKPEWVAEYEQHAIPNEASSPPVLTRAKTGTDAAIMRLARRVG